MKIEATTLVPGARLTIAFVEKTTVDGVLFPCTFRCVHFCLPNSSHYSIVRNARLTNAVATNIFLRSSKGELPILRLFSDKI